MSIDSIRKEVQSCGTEFITGKTFNRLNAMTYKGIFRTMIKAAVAAVAVGIVASFVIPSTIPSLAGLALGTAYFARHYSPYDAIKDSPLYDHLKYVCTMC